MKTSKFVQIKNRDLILIKIKVELDFSDSLSFFESFQFDIPNIPRKLKLDGIFKKIPTLISELFSIFDDAHLSQKRQTKIPDTQTPNPFLFACLPYSFLQ